jgi:hypothetical protein
MTGLNRQAFYSLLLTFAAEYAQAEEKREQASTSKSHSWWRESKISHSPSEATLHFVLF